MDDIERMAHAFVVSLGEHARPIPEGVAIWSRERAAQIDWAGDQTRAGVYPHGPFTYPCPLMTYRPDGSRAPSHQR